MTLDHGTVADRLLLEQLLIALQELPADVALALLDAWDTLE